jgi:hypothetical protein
MVSTNDALKVIERQTCIPSNINNIRSQEENKKKPKTIRETMDGAKMKDNGVSGVALRSERKKG